MRAHTRRTSSGRISNVRRHTRAGGSAWRLGWTWIAAGGRAAKQHRRAAAFALVGAGVAEITAWTAFRLVGIVLMTVLLLLGAVLGGFGIGTTTHGGNPRRTGRCYYCKTRATVYPRQIRGRTVKLCTGCKRAIGAR